MTVGARDARTPGPARGGWSADDADDREGCRRAWLEERLGDTPPELARAVRRLVEELDRDDSGGGPRLVSPEDLVRAALRGFERVAASSQTRERALDLLAADALLTYAFEAAADPGIGGSAARALSLAAATGPRGALGRRAERAR